MLRSCMDCGQPERPHPYRHPFQPHPSQDPPEICALCGQPARGLATVSEQRYCHEGEDPTCYMIASWAQQVPILGRAGDWLIDALETK